ncbi:MAG: GNAT family N-acetyltransferase [Peptoniphilus sp.]|nr:GNAT family N-acetyltransferase [Peptoniphilus sp.]MDY3118284.1 GNAT family N-acetyltransferase [Peptoniphilus sp.]
MKMTPFKDEEELRKFLVRYRQSTNNDYMNLNRYLEELQDLHYYENGDLYIGSKKNGRWHVSYYLKEGRPLTGEEIMVTEVVGKKPDIGAAESVGFRLYKTRERLRLKERTPYFSKRVKVIRDANFVKRGIASFDPVSGNHQPDAVVEDDVKNGRIIGIEGAGFLQFSVKKTEQTIEHLYVEKSWRRRGIALEILRHYVSNCIEKNRATVWTDADGAAENLYEKAGFQKDGMKAAVMVYGPSPLELK